MPIVDLFVTNRWSGRLAGRRSKEPVAARRYFHVRHLSARRLEVRELFHPDALSLPGV